MSAHQDTSREMPYWLYHDYMCTVPRAGPKNARESADGAMLLLNILSRNEISKSETLTWKKHISLKAVGVEKESSPRHSIPGQ